MARSIQALQNSPTTKRQEENHKYLLRKFFRFLQGDHKDPARSFECVFREYLSPEFTEAEATTFFKPIRASRADGKPGEGTVPTSRLSQFAFWKPVQFTNSVISRMTKISRLRESLLAFMQHHLLHIAREEMRTKTLSLIRRFKGYFEDHSYELYSVAMVNSLTNKKLKFWTVNEVEHLIAKMTARLTPADPSDPRSSE